MLFQAPEIELFDPWLVLFWFLHLVWPALLPVATGLIYASRSFWISAGFGFRVGLGISLVGMVVHFASVTVAVQRLPDHFYWLSGTLTSASLVLVLVIQVALTIGLCWFIHRRRHRS